ncbi:MAG: pantoate--beta-alanine ligase [Myxococcota bacterium]|jgi:pantoate--beta-alanine ligase|nr:pantoate--beta-alanine ligase [Myxococcota bacterium]
MVVVQDIAGVRDLCSAARADGKRVAVVPTMGALHEGHLVLVDRARSKGQFVVVTIFVNPTQFGPGEDLSRYPRDLEGDVAKLEQRGVDLVFTPNVGDMYPNGHATTVHVSGLTEHLCGAQRPSHFDGVALIVAKLLNIVGPSTAVFGRKDYQQLRVIRRMVRDLDMPIEVLGVPTVRDADGLAKSSRNAYLGPKERERALAISRGLTAAHYAFGSGERRVDELLGAVEAFVKVSADAIDYVTAADPETLEPLPRHAICSERLLLAVAARFAGTRLIDNTVIGEDSPPLARESRR